MFGNSPPKTTLDNFTNIPHLEKLLLWFLKNDKQLQIINSKAIHTLFNEGRRPECEESESPENLVKKVNDPQGVKTIERWLALKVFLDLIAISTVVEDTQHDLKKVFEKRIDYIEQQTKKTLITAGEIAGKHNLYVEHNLDLETELAKNKTEKEKEDFKQNYLADALISSEARLLGWIFKELFNENYQIKD